MTPARKAINALTNACCRWPLGDPRQDGFRFCGRRRAEGKSYCDLHILEAYQPSAPRSVRELERLFVRFAPRKVPVAA